MSKDLNTQDFDFDNMQILQDVELDDNTAFSKQVSTDEDDGEEEEESENDIQPVKKTTKTPAQPPKIELSDDMILEGLKNTSKAASGISNDEDKDTEEEQRSDKRKINSNSKNTPDPKNAFEAHYRMMVDAGVWKEVDGFDGSRDKYEEAVDFNNKENLNSALDEYLDDAFVNNPEGKAMGMRLIKHLASGGRVSDFQTLQGPVELDFEALVDENEDVANSAAEDILISYYQSQNWDKSDIKTRIEKLKKTGELVDEAKFVEKPYKKQIVDKAEQHAAWLEQTANENKLNAKKLNTGILNLINKNHKFGNLQVAENRTEQAAIQDYIFKPDEKGVTSFRQDLMNNLRDPEFLMFTAIAMRKQLHKNPSILGDNTKNAKNEAKDELEEKLSKSLLNKKIDDKGSFTGIETTGGNSRSKNKFNLDEALVLEG